MPQQILIQVLQDNCNPKLSCRKEIVFSVFIFLNLIMVTTCLDKALQPVPFKWNGSLALLLSTVFSMAE